MSCTGKVFGSQNKDTKLSTTTHEFCRGKVSADGSCLYTSFRDVTGISKVIDNKHVRLQVADYLRKNKSIHDVVLNSGFNCKTVEEYCDLIEHGNIWGGEPELQALVVVSHTAIRLVFMTKTAEDKTVIEVFEYGENIESINECVYILYDGENKHYDPLYVIHKQNSDEKITIFNRGDGIVISLIDQFIQNEQHEDISIQSDCNNLVYATEPPTKRDSPNETEDMSDSFRLSLPKKQKTQEYDSVLPVRNDEIQIPVIMSNENKKDDIRFEIEPALKFRGRTSHEYKPMKAFKRNGQPSEPRPPCYFADRKKNHYLNLLIPEKYLLPAAAQHRLEICLVTREINGHIYYHPYFKFQDHPTDKQITDKNPVYRTLDENDLTNYSKESLSEQPLPIFLSSTNSGSVITTKFDCSDAFKNAYHLHDLRFAITLLSQGPGEKDFHRHENIQYISSVSTEDKEAKVRTNNIS